MAFDALHVKEMMYVRQESMSIRLVSFAESRKGSVNEGQMIYYKRAERRRASTEPLRTDRL